MKSLYESILDTDAEIKTEAEILLLPTLVMKYLKEVFNKDLEPETDVRCIGDWYLLGPIDRGLYKHDNVKGTEDFVIRGIKQIHQNIKKEIKKTLISVETEVYKSGDVYSKTYKVKLWISSHKESTIIFDISLKGTKLAYDLTSIDGLFIWTKNKELADLL